MRVNTICHSNILKYFVASLYFIQAFYWNWRLGFGSSDLNKRFFIGLEPTYEETYEILLKYSETILKDIINIINLSCKILAPSSWSIIIIITIILLFGSLNSLMKIIQIVLYNYIMDEQERDLVKSNKRNIHFIKEQKYANNPKITKPIMKNYINGNIDSIKCLTEQDFYNLITLPDDLLKMIIMAKP
jgi:hypothetical protein